MPTIPAPTCICRQRRSPSARPRPAGCSFSRPLGIVRCMDTLFCSKCGGHIDVQTIGDRPREVCSACGTIFYQNPLPAAAALVLDAERRVLLVRRRFKPNKGMWCLPIGFAEVANPT